MTYREIISKVAESTGVPKETVHKVYMAYWKAVRRHISDLPLKDTINEASFMSYRPCVNIPSLGKLFVTLEKYNKIRGKCLDNIARSEATNGTLQSR